MDNTLKNYFEELDEHIKELGQSDSSIEYAPHIRNKFDKVIYSLNKIKEHSGETAALHKVEECFN